MTPRLRYWRNRRSLSVRELAKRAGVNYVTIVRIETETMSPTVTMLEKLAGALGVNVRDFFPVESERSTGTRRAKR
jgi:transcriptional regulator with XRE-family HTH domain